MALTCAATPAYIIRWRVGFYPTTLLEVMVLVSVAAFVIESIRAGEWPRWPANFMLPVAVFILAGAISVLVAPDRIKALGLYRAYIIEPIVFFVVVANVTRNRPRALWVLAGLGFAGLLASVLNIAAVVEAIYNRTFEIGGNSPAAIYETPNALALFVGPLVAVAGAIAFFDQEQRLRMLAAAFLVIAVAAIALSQSRGGYLALFAVAVALALIHPRRRLLVPTVLVCTVAAALLPPVTARLAHEFNFGDPSNTLASRLRLWAATIRLLAAHPVFGNGLSGFMATIGPYRNGQFTETLMYPHNMLLNAWTETGLLGMVSFVWLYLEAGFGAWRGWRLGPTAWRPIQLGIAVAVVAMAVHGLVDVPYWKNDLSVEFWALVGISLTGLKQAAVEPGTKMSEVPVVTILTRIAVGGPSKHVTMLATKMGLFSGVLLIGKPQGHEGSLAEEAVQAGAKLLTVPGLKRDVGPLDDLKALIWLYWYFRRVRPQVVSTHTAKAGLLGRLAALLAGVPVRIHTFHGHVLRGYFSSVPSKLFQLMERGLAASSSCLIAVSPEIAADLDSMNIGRGKTVVIRLGFDLDQMVTGTRGRLREPLGIAPGVPLVGIVARLAPVKDHQLFLAAARLLLQQRPDIRFAIVGDGELWGHLQAQALELGIGEQVCFTGWRHDLPDVYADLDVVVCSSVQEGTPVAIIEAGAAGKPVVSTNVGGVADVVVHGETGILVDDREPSTLAAAIDRMLSDPSMATRMGAAGRRLVLRRYHVDEMVTQTAALYRDLLDKTAALPQPDGKVST